MPDWTKLADKAVFRVKQYDSESHTLILTMYYLEVEGIPFQWTSSYIQNQIQFCKQLSVLHRDAMQTAIDLGAPLRISANETYYDLDDVLITILEEYQLDYVQPQGILVPDVPSIWNPFRADDDPTLEDMYIFRAIDLHYRLLDQPQTYEPSPQHTQHFYHGHSYFLPPMDTNTMDSGSVLIYLELGGEDLDNDICVARWCAPGFLGYLQNIPLDLLQQLYYHGGWPIEILGVTIWALFDGSPSHPNYTDPSGDDPTSCFYGKHIAGITDYLAVTTEEENSCVNYAERTYNRHVALWKRAFWWNYIMAQNNPPFSVIQSGGYLGADHAELRFGGKLLPEDDPIIYDGPHTFKATSQPLVVLALLNGFLGPHLKKKDEDGQFGKQSATYNNETMIYNGETLSYD